MKVIDNYLQSVQSSLFLIPAKEKEDIVRELSEEIHSAAERKEEELGRALTEEEQQQMLQPFGHPLLVAGRYRQNVGSVSFGPTIIGPELFPLYRFVLTINLSVTAIVAAVVVLLRGSLEWESMLFPLLVQMTIATVTFAIADASLRRSNGQRWTAPSATAPAVDANRIPRANSVMEIIIGLLAIGLWNELPWYPHRALGIKLQHWTPGPTWNDFHSTFFAPVLLLLIVSLVLSFVNLFRSVWSRPRLLTSALINFSCTTMIGMTLWRHAARVRDEWTTLQVSRSTLSKLELFNGSIDVTIFATMAIFALITLGYGLHALIKAQRLKRTVEPMVTAIA